VVIAAGPGRRDKRGALCAPTLRRGQRVVFSNGSGNEISVDNDRLRIIKESDVLAIIQHSPFAAWADWTATTQSIEAAALIGVIVIVAAWALGIVG
jgi:Chaperonin 10 Kd subunit